MDHVGVTEARNAMLPNAPCEEAFLCVVSVSRIALMQWVYRSTDVLLREYEAYPNVCGVTHRLGRRFVE